MRILLCNPPAGDNRKFIREGRCTQEQGVWSTLWPPVTLATTGAVVERDGHDVVIIDCPARGMSAEGLTAELGRFRPDVVCWSTGTPSIASDLSFAAAVKAAVPEAFTAAMGTHVTALDRQCMEQAPQLDCVVRNEPEMTFSGLVAALAAGRPLSAVDGITCRRDGSVYRTADRPFLEDIDSLPFPAWHLLDIADYRLPLKGRPFLIVAPQRGCPFACTFCTCQTYYGQKLRKRSPGRVLDEIEYDISRFGIRDFFIWAETFVLDRNYVADLCEGVLKRDLAVSWTCNSRVDIVDPGLLALMARAGCWMISFGIESCDQGVLNAVGKGTTPAMAEEAIRAARNAGIKTAGHFIFGLPGETEQTMEKTISWSVSLGLDIAQFYCCAPFPGSRLYEQALQEQWIRVDTVEGMNQDHACMELPGLPYQTVERCRRDAYRRFYARPQALVRLLGMTEMQGLGRIRNTLSSFLRWSGIR